MTEPSAPKSLTESNHIPDKQTIDRPISIALVFFLPLGLLILFGILAGILMTFDLPLLAFITIVQVFAIVVPTIWLFSNQKWGMVEMTSPKIPKFSPTLSLILFLAAFIVLSDALTLFLVELLPEALTRSIIGMMELQAQLVSSNTPFEWVVLVLVVVFGPAIFEELLCRGLFLKACTQRMPAAPAIILNGIFFGVLHQSMVIFTYYFLIGAIFSWIALRSGTLIYGMILHALLNATVLGLSAKYHYSEGFPIPFPIAVIGGIGCCVVGLYLFHLTTRQPHKTVKPESA